MTARPAGFRWAGAWAGSPWAGGWLRRVARPAVWLERLGAWWVRSAPLWRGRLWLPVAAMAGDAGYFAWPSEPGWLVAPGLVAVGAVAAADRRHGWVHGLGLGLLLGGLGFGSAQLAAWRAPGFVPLPGRMAAIEGRVAERDVLPEGVRLTLADVRVDGVALGVRRLRLRVAADRPSVEGDAEAGGSLPGAWVRVRGMVAVPSPPAYPGGRDLQRDGYFAALAGSGYARGAVAVVRAAPVGWPGGPVGGWLAAGRARVAARVRAVLPGTAGAIGATLLTGLSAAIPQADRDAFRDAGLSHLLAIAGLHIGIVMGLVLALVRGVLVRWEHAALCWPVRQIAAVAALCGGFAYLLGTGVHVPTMRSFAMAGLAVVALLVGRRAVSLRNWGLAALLVIAVEPEQVTGASFQLSFAAVLALIAGYEALGPWLLRLRAGAGGGGGRWRLVAHHAVTLGLTSLLAGTASLPFIAYHFGRIQLYFVLANMVAVPLTAAWVMPAGLVAVGLMPLGLDRPALVVMGWGLRAVLWVARTVAGWPAATVAVPHVPLAGLLLMALGVAGLCLARGRMRLAGLVPVVAGLVVATLSRPPWLLVSADSRLVGVVGADAVAVRAVRGGDGYVAEAWAQFVGRPVRVLGAADGCGAAGCTLGEGARRVTLVGADGGVGAACGAAVLVAQSGAPPYCPGAVLIGRESTWRDGALRFMGCGW